MRKDKLKLKICGKILSTVILLSFLMTFPMYGEPLTEPPPSSSESGTRLYSDLEVDTLIDEISEAALEAIEQAAGEAAKAAVLSVIEREAAAMREAQRWRLEAEMRQLAIVEAKKNGTKNAILAGAVLFICGLAVGVGGTLIIGGR
jgi:hypothetical protein